MNDFSLTVRSLGIAAAAALATVAPAAADITVTLQGTTYTGWNFSRAVDTTQYRVVGSFSGASINVTLDSSVAFTYADDLCVYVDIEPFSTGGILQLGGFSTLGAAQRYFWPNGGSSTPGTTSIGTVNFPTALAFSGDRAIDGTVWIGNGWAFSATSGTWTGTIVLHGIDAIPCETLYRDLDEDGFGNAESGAITSCVSVPGFVGNNFDCDDTNAGTYPGAAELCNEVDDDCDGETDEGVLLTYWRDMDADGFGDAQSDGVLACLLPAGYVANSLDCNDADASVNPVTMEICLDGVDNDCDGVTDCFALTLEPSSSSLPPSPDSFRLRASCTAPSQTLGGLSIILAFDATRLRLESVEPVGSSPMSLEIIELVDNTAGTVRYAIGLSDPAVGLDTAAELCEFSFSVLPGAAGCGSATIAGFATIGGFSTRFTTVTGQPVSAQLVGPGATQLDGVPPVLVNVPGNVVIAADAGSAFGAFVPLAAVTAVDDCDGSVAVVATGLREDGVYPIGTSTVVYSATDAAGNTATAVVAIVVENRQLLDVAISLGIAPSQPTVRPIRLTVGSFTQVVSAFFANGATATVAGVPVPVASGYDCASGKDPAHSITDSSPVAILGRRYTTALDLVQGDANDDDAIEILDYGFFLVDRSIPGNPFRAPDARSNYNSDGFVTITDLAILAVSFYRAGEPCAVGVDPPPMRTRISAKELRRRGLGELVAADINGDGWLDLRDVQAALAATGVDGPTAADALLGGGQ